MMHQNSNYVLIKDIQLRALFFVHHGVKHIVDGQQEDWNEVGQMRTHSSKETRTHLVKMQTER